MKITIDTKEDSHEEIQKVIKMLSSLVEGKEIISNQRDIFGDDSSQTGDDSQTQGSDIFNMFNSSSENRTDETSEDKKEEDEDLGIDIPEVQEYH